MRSIALSSSRSKVSRPHVAPFAGPQWHVAGLALAIAVLLQATLVHYLSIRGVTPSLVLVVVVWYATRVDLRRAIGYGLLAGLCEDALAAGTGIAWTLSTALTATLTNVLSRGFFADSIALVASMSAFATLARALLFWIVMSLGGYPSGLSGMHAHQAVFEAAYNAVVAIVAMIVLRRFERAKS